MTQIVRGDACRDMFNCNNKEREGSECESGENDEVWRRQYTCGTRAQCDKWAIHTCTQYTLLWDEVYHCVAENISPSSTTIKQHLKQLLKILSFKILHLPVQIFT